MINQIELLIFSQYYYQYFIWYKIFNLKILKIIRYITLIEILYKR